MKPSPPPARKHFGGSLEGKILVTGGMGGMGGAQPLAATMNGAAFLGIEVDPARHATAHRYRLSRHDDSKPRRSLEPCHGRSRSTRDPYPLVSWETAPTCLPEMVRRGWTADVLTDQTSAHDPLNGYIPRGLTLEAAANLRSLRSEGVYQARHRIHGHSRPGHARHAEARRRHI